ncbi:MAG: hypothetical protein KJO98_06155, partial [Rhodothermia bacterium]|nr:hypothetical protein [Rhodothermia bacterium]
MNLSDQIRKASDNPEGLERLYHDALEAGSGDSFQENMLAAYRERPENVLLAAWYHRLESSEPISQPVTEAHRPWARAILIGLLTGLALWAVSDPDLVLLGEFPYLALLWSPIAAVSAMVLLVWSDPRRLQRAILVSAALVAVCIYVLILAPIGPSVPGQNHLILMALHLPVLAFAAVGVTLVGVQENPPNRFAFLSKSLEIFVAAGLFGITGMITLQISAGMFETQGLVPPEWAIRLIACLAAGSLPLLAIVTVYDPTVEPLQQDFGTGLSRVIATILNVVLPVVCGIMILY